MLFKISEEKFDELLRIVRFHQGEEIHLFVDTDKNGSEISVGIDNNYGDIIRFEKKDEVQ